MTMLVSYMQLLGLLRLVRLNWSHWMEQVLKTLTYIDFTSGASTWVSVECSFAEGALPKSLKRSLVLMLWPLGALMFLGIIWLSYAYITTRLRRVRHGVRRQIVRLEPYMVLSAVTMLYFLYTPTSREIISLFSCQPVDTEKALQDVAPTSKYTSDAVAALANRTPKDGWQGVWTSDTSVMCSSPAHVGVAIGLGIPGLIVWVFGLPIMLWVMLKRNSRVNEFGVSKLEDPLVSCQLGKDALLQQSSVDYLLRSVYPARVSHTLSCNQLILEQTDRVPASCFCCPAQAAAVCQLQKRCACVRACVTQADVRDPSRP
eukprot:GHUV01024468.1.p1 GENE.GHUV01024468.1~~GHUV01024468.1.p1  ORF type:complete len:339 (+),score=62.81 GHUV01024468.1:70-1017(+)